MWQKQQQVGNHMTCAPFVKLVEWKIWKQSKRICWMKLQSHRIQGCHGKLWSQCDTNVVPKLFSTRPLSGFPCFESLGILSCMCGAHCWPDLESRTETILASDSSSESLRPPWWFFVAGKEPGLLRFSSKHSTPWGVFRKDRIVGASCRWFSRHRRPKKRLRQN